MRYKYFFAWAVIVFGITNSYANQINNQLKENFIEVRDEHYKGPYACYARQTNIGRYCYIGKKFPNSEGKTYFYSAFRDTKAQELIDKGIYVANLFATNFHYLYAKHVIGDSLNDGFEIEPSKFIQNEKITEDVLDVFRHTMLERYYNIKYPRTLMATVFHQRGTGGSEYEEEYFEHFIKNAATYIESRKDYLILYEAINQFDIKTASSISMKNLRDDVDLIYKTLEGDSVKNEFFNIRNMIHNTISVGVILKVEQFLQGYSGPVEIREKLTQYLSDIREYFDTNAETIKYFANHLTDKLSDAQIKQIGQLKDDIQDVRDLESLSQIAVEVYQNMDKGGQYDPESIRFIVNTNKFIQSKLVLTNSTKFSENLIIQSRLNCSLNAIYASGLLKKKQFVKIREDIDAFVNGLSGRDETRLRGVIDTVSRAPSYVSANLIKSLGNPLTSWVSIDNKMNGIIDDILKSSVLLDLASFSNKVRSTIQGTSKNRIMNEGESYGYLRYISKDDMLGGGSSYTSLDGKSIPVFESLPTDLTVVAGVITLQDQTELDHVNLKSNQRGTPNLVYPGILESDFSSLIEDEALVHIVFTNESISIEKAESEVAELFWKEIKPQSIGDLPIVDTNTKKVFESEGLGYEDSNLVGAKAANYAEIYNALRGAIEYDVVRKGFAIPFAYYKEFLTENGINQKIVQAIAEIKEKRNPIFTENKLTEIRNLIMNTNVSAKLIKEVKNKLEATYPNLNIRFRSSTNSEDLKNFSGAGLYSSISYRPNSRDRTIENAIKTVWSSLWNRRAFDEREYYGINHETVFAAIQINPGFPNEEGNGVAISKNIKNVQSETGLKTGIYLNNQYGEASVTNPEDGEVVEEIVVLFDKFLPQSFSTKYEDNIILRRSSETTVNRETGIRNLVFSGKELNLITNLVRRLHKHLKAKYDPKDLLLDFAIDLEFKVDDLNTGDRKVYFKQARPYVD